MIEAVNSVLSNAPYTRVAAEQQSVTNSYAANPERIQVVTQAPYISPYIHVDVNFDKAVLQLRDADTGDVVRQIPSESQMEAYRRAQDAAQKPQTYAKEAVKEATTATPKAETTAPSAPQQTQQTEISTAVISGGAATSAPAQSVPFNTQA